MKFKTREKKISQIKKEKEKKYVEHTTFINQHFGRLIFILSDVVEFQDLISMQQSSMYVSLPRFKTVLNLGEMQITVINT